MKRIPFAIVERQVDAMYDFSITDQDKIERRCLDIQDFIQKCGWNLDDYIKEIMGYTNTEYN